MATLSLVLTVLSDDRPGLVESLAAVITAHNGNWLESRMAHLAGQFAGILRASVPEDQAEALMSALQGLASQGLRVVVKRSTTEALPRDQQWLRLNVVGNDHPGIVRDLAHALKQYGINIDELYTECSSAPMSGTALFKATAQLRVPPQVVVADLQEHLERLAHDLMVDVLLEEVSSGQESVVFMPSPSGRG